MERCPNCRARLRDEDPDSCRRCGMELALLVRTEQAAEALTYRAVAQLAAGDREGACAALRQAQGLNADPLRGHLLGFLESRNTG